MDFKKDRFAVIGMARSGIAAAYKIKKYNGYVFLSDSKKEEEIAHADEIKADFDCEFGGNSDKVLEADVIIVSPGVPLTIPILEKARMLKKHIISEIEFAYKLTHPHSKIISVTGSNGKSTTVSLIYHLLKTAGFNVLLAGNIGDAFSSFDIEEKYDWIVLELSSFQLDLIETFKPDIAILMNITPDHLYRYESFDHYALSKFRMFMNQDIEQKAILFKDDETINKYAHLIKSDIKWFSLIENTDAYYEDGRIYQPGYEMNSVNIFEMPIKGPHNYCNIMAAILTVRDIIEDKEVLSEGLKSFRSLSHRLEPVRDLNGIHFVNDSKATNTDSVRFALRSFDRPIRIIMGGSDKGEDFRVLNEDLQKNAKKVYIIGATKEKMIEAYTGIVEYEVFDDFESCIIKAYQDSEEGDYVVLSPACASFDMFNNYEHRGDVFRQIVENLQ